MSLQFIKLQPLRHFGTIKHVSALTYIQARDYIIAANISHPLYAFKMNVRSSVRLLYLLKRLFLRQVLYLRRKSTSFGDVRYIYSWRVKSEESIQINRFSRMLLYLSDRQVFTSVTDSQLPYAKWRTFPHYILRLGLFWINRLFLNQFLDVLYKHDMYLTLMEFQTKKIK